MRKHALELVIVLAAVALLLAGMTHIAGGPVMPRPFHHPPPPPPPRPIPPPPVPPPPPPPPDAPAHYRADSPRRSELHQGRPGSPLRLAFEVRDPAGARPLQGAKVEVWHPDDQGNYSLPPDHFGRGWAETDAAGRVEFETVHPVGSGPARRSADLCWRISRPGIGERWEHLALSDLRAAARRTRAGTVARLAGSTERPVVQIQTTLTRPAPPPPRPHAPPPVGPPAPAR